MVDLWPYSQRQDGSVNDREHEYLWSGLGDGVLPRQDVTACRVELSGSQWVVQPGRLLILGHVLDLDTVQVGDIPAPANAVRRCTVVAYVDHAQTPWTYGVGLLQGTPGGGRPAVSKSYSGRYEVALRSFEVATNGGVTMLPDERPYVENGAVALPATVMDRNNTGDEFAYTAFQTGDSAAAVTFQAPQSGRILAKVSAMAKSAGGNGQRAIFGFSIREGDANGTLVYNPTTYDGPIMETDRFVMAEVETMVSGLVPGRTYFARTAQRSSGGTCTVAHLKLIVTPAS